MSIAKIPDDLLDRLIDVLSEARTHTADITGPLYQAEKAVHDEWKRRYPGTIAPCLHRAAMERGGFPPCYKGSRRTVRKNEV